VVKFTIPLISTTQIYADGDAGFGLRHANKYGGIKPVNLTTTPYGDVKLTGLIPPYLFACLKPKPASPSAYICVVDISGIVDHNFFKNILKIQKVLWTPP
jgi:hypothetical protein